MELPEESGSRLTVKSPKARRRRKSRSPSPAQRTVSAKVFDMSKDNYEPPRAEFQNPK